MDSYYGLPVTTTEIVNESFGILFFEIMIATLGVAMLRIVGQKSPVKQRHGRFVLVWMLLGWAVGGLIGLRLIDNRQYMPVATDYGLAAMAMLMGWAIGLVHGAIVVWLMRVAPRNHEIEQPARL